MAQAITCDDPECGQLASVLWSLIDTGDVTAYCADHFAGACMGVAVEVGLADAATAVRIAELEAAGVLQAVEEPKPKPARRGKAAAAAAAGPDQPAGQGDQTEVEA